MLLDLSQTKRCKSVPGPVCLFAVTDLFSLIHLNPGGIYKMSLPFNSDHKSKSLPEIWFSSELTELFACRQNATQTYHSSCHTVMCKFKGKSGPIIFIHLLIKASFSIIR